MKGKCEGERWGRVLYGLFAVIGLLPGWWHYLCSDLLSYILQYIIKYRRTEIEEHIKACFPHLSPKEQKQLVRANYLNLTDLLVELIRMCAFTPRQMSKRVKINNLELIDNLINEGYPSIYMLLGHYGNWEWLTGLQLHLPHTQFEVLYHHQSSTWHYIVSRLRTKFGAHIIDKEEAPRTILRQAQEKLHRSYIFVADQAPPLPSSHLFMQFLGRPTAVFTGMERLAIHGGNPVVYIDVCKPHRGYYEVTVKLLTLNAKQEAEHYIVAQFMRELEATIRRAPQYWLWSHRRWKHSPEQVRQAYPNKEIIFI